MIGETSFIATFLLHLFLLCRVYALGAASDHAAFIGIAGVPCIDVRYTHTYPIIDYPLYHSVYETFHLFDEILDKDYKVWCLSFTTLSLLFFVEV